MKKAFKTLLLAAVAALPLLQSCNDKEYDGWNAVALVNVEHSVWSGSAASTVNYSFVDDGGATYHVTALRNAAISNEAMAAYDRGLIYFREAAKPADFTADAAIELWGFVPAKIDISRSATSEEVLKQESEKAKFLYPTNTLWILSGDYFNFTAGVYAAKLFDLNENHRFILTRIEGETFDDKPEWKEYEVVYLIHQSDYNENTASGQPGEALVSINIKGNYDKQTTGKKGLVIRYYTADSAGKPVLCKDSEAIRIDYPEERR